MDYIAVTDVSPRSILVNYDQTKFQGKGIARLLLNIIQVVNLAVSDGDCENIVIKSSRELESLYRSIGFQKAKQGEKMFKTASMKSHFAKMKQDKSLMTYYLKNNHVIRYTFDGVFVNHVQREILDEVINLKETKTLVDDLHKYFGTVQFQKDVTKCNSLLVDSGQIIVPIGKGIVKIFQSTKSTRSHEAARLYEYIISQIIWKLNVQLPSLKKRKKSVSESTSIKNPKCDVEITCNFCGKIFDTIQIIKDNHFQLDRAETLSQTKRTLRSAFDTHFGLNNKPNNTSLCSEINDDIIGEMKEARDKQWSMLDVEVDEQFAIYDQKEFNKLMRLTLETHSQCQDVINYFRWDQFGRSGTKKRQLRVSSMLDFSLKKKRTVEEVLGENQASLREELQTSKQNRSNVRMNRVTKGEAVITYDDFIFIKYLESIMFLDTKLISKDDLENIYLSNVSNKKAYIDEDTEYYFGYVQSQNASALDDDTVDDSVEDDQVEDDMNEYFKIAPRILSQDFVIKFFKQEEIERIKEKHLQKVHIKISTKRAMMSSGVNNLRCLNVTHIYKFKGRTDNKIRFCNVIPKQKHIQINKEDKLSYVIVKEDIIDQKWLNELVVNQYGCEEWWTFVNNKKTSNTIYALPVASVSESSFTKPVQEKKAPVILFPQGSVGICGICAFASAFAYFFN